MFEPAPHAEREAFWDELRALCAEAGAAPASLGAVAVAVGPGGFTGLRVSIAFAKAVALSCGIPAVSVPSAPLFAASDQARGGKGPWLVALAAKTGTAWCALVRDPAAHGSAGDVVDRAGFAQLVEEAAREGGVVLHDEHLGADLAADVAAAGVATRAPEVDMRAFALISAQFLACGRAAGPDGIMPIYAREPEAVTNWRARGHDAGR
jgi:tRNA threonylcarbamoyladenosine biosynthesis protein TsaB